MTMNEKFWCFCSGEQKAQNIKGGLNLDMDYVAEIVI